jgi:hypothetical protein
MNKSLAKEIIGNICMFIKFYLHLSFQSSSAKSKLVHGISELISFLGFKIGLYPTKYNYKSQYLIRFYKLKANVQRKKIFESEKYLKMQERIFSKLHREVVHSIAITGQALVKKSRFKSAYAHWVKSKVVRSLKKSLAIIEAKLLASSLVSRIFKSDILNPKISLVSSEQKRFHFLKDITQKWIKDAQAIANEEDFTELQVIAGDYLSPDFIKARDSYLKELNVIFSKDFSEKVTKNVLSKAVSHQVKHGSIRKVEFNNRSIRILFPKDRFVKKLRSIRVIHKVITRPAGIGFLTSLKDHDIVKWYALKANAIWNFYSCSDNIWEVKNVINWMLRYSLFGTLAKKHKSSIKKCIQEYSFSPTLYCSYESINETKSIVLTKYPTLEFINNKKKVFNSSSLSFIKLEKILKINTIYSNCAVLKCDNDVNEICYIGKSNRHFCCGVINSSRFYVIKSRKKIAFILNKKL